MGINIQAWNQSYTSFENQVKEFNDKIQKTDLTKEDVSKIYQTVKEEVKRLSAFAEAAKAREEKLEKGEGCCSPSRKQIVIIGLLNGASKICSIAGAGLAFADNTIITKGIGVGIFTIGTIFDAATTIYEAKVYLDVEESSALAKLNKEGVEHAKIFKKFLKQLKEIKQMEEQLLDEYRSHTKQPLSQHTVINLGPTKNLDACISACLKEYEELPTCYRHEEVYCRIISQLIQRLPSDDPLRIGLEDLEPNTREEDISTFADQSLPTHYLPNLKKRKSSSEDKWQNEEKAHSKEKTSLIEEVDSTDPQLEYTQRVAYYKHLVTQRFNLKYNMEFFDTAKGWRINCREGIKKIPKSEEDQSANSYPVKVNESTTIITTNNKDPLADSSSIV